MRKVTYGAACSLDGFIAAADGGLDWLHFSKDVEQAMAAYWATIDTLLMGRKTYAFAAAQGGGASADATTGSSGGMTTYVFSRTLTTIPGKGTHLVSTDAGEFVRSLKQQHGKDICVMGGGELAQSLLAAGVIDEVGVNVHPILLGAGTPLFRDAGRVKLELMESRVIDGGCVLANYRVLS
jgi:dihydrofolate reductase